VEGQASATISSGGRLTVTPAPGFEGTVRVKVNVRQVDLAPDTVDPTGDSQTIVFKFGPLGSGNHAPELDNTLDPKLPAIQEDTQNPADVQVATLLKGAVNDPDGSGALRGIAVTGQSSHGRWQYLLKSGDAWADMGATSKTSSLLIPGYARIRFVPDADFNGTAKLWYRAWDQTEGQPGALFNLSGKYGGQHAFSTALEVATQVISPVNDAPVLVMNGSIDYVRDSSAIRVAPAALVSDVDSGNFSGGRLRVRIDSGASYANRLAIGPAFTVDATNNVLRGTTIIGKRTFSGVGLNELVIVFTEGATPAIAQLLARSICFRTICGISGSKPAIITTVSDGDGGISAEQVLTVHVR
jgi:hypothetical protein